MSLVPQPDPRRRERRVALLLFVATVVSTAGCHFVWWQAERTVAAAGRSVVFAVALMGILVAHEFGHLWMARRHGLRVSAPVFLPMPVVVGTLGAIISIRERPPTRRAQAQMALAGPVAGLVTITGVLAVAMLGHVPDAEGGVALARPLVFWLMAFATTMEAPPEVYAADPLLFAAWVGCLVTALNLVPIGQLDGGHVLSALAPDLHGRIGWVATIGLLLMGFVWWFWAVWAAVVRLLAASAPMPAASKAPPVHGRRLGVAALVTAALCAVPVPVSLVDGPVALTVGERLALGLWS